MAGVDENQLHRNACLSHYLVMVLIATLSVQYLPRQHKADGKSRVQFPALAAVPTDTICTPPRSACLDIHCLN